MNGAIVQFGLCRSRIEKARRWQWQIHRRVLLHSQRAESKHVSSRQCGDVLRRIMLTALASVQVQRCTRHRRQAKPNQLAQHCCREFNVTYERRHCSFQVAASDLLWLNVLFRVSTRDLLYVLIAAVLRSRERTNKVACFRPHSELTIVRLAVCRLLCRSCKVWIREHWKFSSRQGRCFSMMGSIEFLSERPKDTFPWGLSLPTTRNDQRVWGG